MKKILTKLSILSVLGLIFTGTAFAAITETFYSSEIQANVSEVLASRTLTVGVTPADTETITIGSCVITFLNSAGTGDNSTSTDEIDCADNTASINNYTLTNPGVQRTTSQIADVLDTLINVSDSTHGALTVAVDTAGSTKFTAGTGVDGDITFTDGTGGDITATTTVTGVAAVAQVVDFTPSTATNTPGITYRAVLNTNDYDYTTDGTGESVATITAALQPLMDSEGGVSCVDNTTKVTCSADIPGTAFSFYASTVDEAAPMLLDAFTDDVDGNGKIDRIDFWFSESMDATITDTTGIAVTGYSVISGAWITDTNVNDIFSVTIGENGGVCDASDQSGCDTDTTPSVSYTPGTLQDSNANALGAISTGSTDEALPVILAPNGGISTFNTNKDENTTNVDTIIASEPVLFALWGNDSALFSINTTGDLVFNATPNFENPTDVNTDGVYEVTVMVNDAIGFDILDFAITVDNVNEAPTDVALSGTHTIDENLANNTVGFLTATDPDASGNTNLDLYYLTGHGFACATPGVDDVYFEINSNNELRVGSSALDYENPTDANGDGAYEICIRAADDAGLFFDKNFTITVNDINDAPVITSDLGGDTAAVNAAENQTAVTTVVASDQDSPAQALTYSIIGGVDAGEFALDANTGVLTFITAPNFEIPTDANGDNDYEVQVRVLDDGPAPTGTDVQTINVTVTNVAEASTKKSGSKRVSKSKLAEIFGKKEVKEVKEVKETKGNTTPACNFSYSRLIRYGTKGEDVKALQTLLNSLGYNTGVADGWYGPNTYKGIKAFQAATGILQDGIVGPQSTAKLMGRCSA